MKSIQALAGKRILVVEDEYYAAVEFCEHLRELGLDPMPPAASVTEALRRVEEMDDAGGAILDVNLGGEMVFPVADALERRSIPFVFVTGYEPNVVPHRHANKILLRKPLASADLAAALLGSTNYNAVSPRHLEGNGILRALPPAQLKRLAPKFRMASIGKGAVLKRHASEAQHVYFPLECVVAMIAVGRSGTRVETGIIGREGITGFDIAHDDRYTPHELVVQIPGACLSLSTDDFQSAIAAVPELAALTSRFARAMATQLAYTALANAKLDVRSKLARWLLMLDDRSASHTPLELTHEHLASMIGVRRSSVTDALHLLEGDHLIRSSRSAVEVLNRKGLIAFAGEAYGIPEDEFTRLMSLPLAEHGL